MNQIELNNTYELLNVIGKEPYLLVHSKSFYNLEFSKALIQPNCVEFTNFTANPLYEDVCEGVEIFKNKNCKKIVAVGGGSAIDVAKCIKLFAELNADKNYLDQDLKTSCTPLIAIPTTAGTGSESTKTSVIYFNNIKQSIAHISALPNYYMLDANVLKNLPKKQKLCTMLDALCQALESWWSIKSCEESVEYSKIAIKLIMENWENYIINNGMKEASQIMKAANYAGRAINITATTAAHAMSYKMNSLYSFPHGQSVALCFKELWKFTLENYKHKCVDKRGFTHLKHALKEMESIFQFEKFMQILNILKTNRPISQNITQDLSILLSSVNAERLANNPILLDENDLKNIYERIIS